MKKFLLLNALAFMLMTSVFSQSVPLGMKYQAVARDSKGQVIANQNISLKIILLSQENVKPTSYYSEVHEITTNELGLFTLVVGGGKVETGTFKDVPWSTQDIWMQVSIKDSKTSDFSIISNSKLLAVPYAFHAATASELVGKSVNNRVELGASNSTSTTVTNTTTSGPPTTGVPSNTWITFGNLNTNPLTDKLGTTDYQDLVVVTNNLERLRIYANGDIEMKRNLRVGQGLIVDSSVTLNSRLGSTLNKGAFTVGTTTMQSSTSLYGPLTVYQKQPTLLSGTLTVDLASQLNSSLNVAGITTLNSNVYVTNQSPTKLTGTLNVDGNTDLNSNLTVNNGKPTVLTGALRVDDTLLITNGRQSTSTNTGALVVTGGLGLGKNLNVGGDANFGGHTTFGGAVAITDLTESTDPTTGALTVGGGVGIGKRLNVAGATQLNSKLKVIDSTSLGSTLKVTGPTTLYDTLGVTGATTLKSSLGVNGIATINNTTGSSNTTSGALQVAGGVGIAQNANVGGTLTTTGATTLNNKLTVNAATSYIAEFNNSTDANGIAIKIATSQAKNQNHYVTFKDGANNIVGRIQGQTLDELHNDDDYKLELLSKTYDVISGAISVGIATVNLAEAVDFQISADASVNACAGLGIVACPPIASFVAGSIAEVAMAAVEEALVIADVAVASDNLDKWKTNKDNSIGVTYQSGSGDYAEYLLKQQPDEKLYPGDLVGIKGGKISKNIEGAEKVMVVSQKPIVLGNTPTPAFERNYDKVAFMGQVKVKVFGKVSLGDYIIPNGLNNGVGLAVSPANISAKDVKNIVGIAWSTSDAAVGLSEINVAVGLNVNDNQKIIEEQRGEIDDLKNQIAQTNAQLEKLVPGFKAAIVSTSTSTPRLYKTASGRNTAKVVTDDNVVPTTLQYPLMGANQVEYVEITKSDFVNGFAVAEERLNAIGKGEKLAGFWKKFNSDPAYKEDIIGKLMKQYKVQLDHHKALDSKLNH